jgi:hypothetical protein
MIVEQLLYRTPCEKAFLHKSDIAAKAQLLLVFGAKELIINKSIFAELRSMYPCAYIMGCSTAGEIYEKKVADNTLTATAIYFENTAIKFAAINIQDYNECGDAAEALSQRIPKENLKQIFLISEGVNVNGSKLVSKLRESLPEGVTVTGGLSGDGSNFQETYVLANAYAKRDTVVIAAFYGDKLKTGYGSVGGWTSFGIARVVTKSENNILYELDGKPVLDLYKEYLGEYAKGLPLSGLYFPLNIRSEDGKCKFVRTILGVNEADKSLTFTGDIPEGCYAKLMRASSNALIDGAVRAAENTAEILGQRTPKLVIMISCVGRKLVLKQMVDCEVEATREVFGDLPIYTGFYSYGEISHSERDAVCELHNQTMTITAFDED